MHQRHIQGLFLVLVLSTSACSTAGQNQVTQGETPVPVAASDPHNLRFSSKQPSHSMATRMGRQLLGLDQNETNQADSVGQVNFSNQNNTLPERDGPNLAGPDNFNQGQSRPANPNSSQNSKLNPNQTYQNWGQNSYTTSSTNANMNSSQNQDLSASQYKEQNQSQSQNLNSSLIQSDRQAPAANVAVPQGRLFTPVEVNPNPYSNPYSALSSNLATGNGQTGPSFGKAQNNMSVQAQTQSPSQYRTPSIGNSGNYAITQVEDRALVDAQSKHLINFQIEATCRVAELIGDDTRGRPHQRFLLGLSNGTTVLVAHNTSLAPKVPLKPGDIVRIKGEYIWNQKGGVIHYTHHTTNLNHQGGWIQLGSQLYY